MNRRSASNSKSLPPPSLEIHFGDNFPILRGFAEESFHLIYIDPPFNTGKTQSRSRLKTTRDADGDRTGFQGRRYKTTRLGSLEFPDAFSDYLDFLGPRLQEAYRLLHPTGSLFLHVDYREVHYCKILLDRIFGRDSFINEIIWSYDYGGRSRSAGRPSTTTSLVREKPQGLHVPVRRHRPDSLHGSRTGRSEEGRPRQDADRYLVANGGQPDRKGEDGLPDAEAAGDPGADRESPLQSGDRVLDFFAGSGTTGEAAVRAGRSAVLIDSHPDAVRVMRKRLAFAKPALHGMNRRLRESHRSALSGQDELEAPGRP